MDDTDGGKSEQALRLALSYREKARILTRECEEAREAGRIQDAEYRKLQEFYARHAQHAQERLDRLRQEHRRSADTLRESIQDTARRQAELGDLAAARDIGVRKANSLNRRYRATIEEQRARYRLEERLASVEDASEAGGFIDRPLDRYQANSRERGVTLPGMDRLVATAVAVLGSLSVFLPWLSLNGEVRPLAGVPALLGLETSIGAGAVTAILVVFLVAPLVGAVFAWLENPRRGGSGMVTTGVGMLALVALGILALGMLTPGEIPLTDILRGLRLGVFLYVIAAVQLLLLGARRTRTTAANRNRGGVLVGVAGIVITLAVLAVAFHVTTGSSQASVRFTFAAPNSVTGAVSIQIANEGSVPANVYAPWPEGRAENVPSDERARMFGLDLYVKEAGSDPFRLYPASQDCWRYNGRPLSAGTPVQVLPDAEATLELLPFEARQGGVNPKAVRITATDANGKRGVSFETELPATAN